MDLISWIIFIFLSIRLIVVGYNYISHPFLPKGTEIKKNILLSILIPARNEEEKIPSLLMDLVSQQPVAIEILVYDDLSTDNTAQVVNLLKASYPEICLIQGKELPSGWLGKNHACYHLAQAAQGDYFLFLDADVRVGREGIPRIISYIQSQKLSLLSLFPRQQLNSIGSWLTVPLMNWILLSLLPIPLVRKTPYPSLAAANGQCMLFDANEYRKQQPHATVRTNPVEDIAIIKLYKEKDLPVDLLLGSDDFSCHMYSGLKDSITGFSKNIFQFFGGHIILAFLFALITTFPCVWLFYKAGIIVFLAWLFGVIIIRILFSLLSNQNTFFNLLLIIPQQIMLWIILLNAYISSKRHSIVWKERNI